MRLSTHERQSIRTAVEQHMPNAAVFLYGSRTDDKKRGGDIDILVISDRRGYLQDRVNILCDMYDAIGEQRIDLLLEQRDNLGSFASMIFAEAVPL